MRRDPQPQDQKDEARRRTFHRNAAARPARLSRRRTCQTRGRVEWTTRCASPEVFGNACGHTKRAAHMTKMPAFQRSGDKKNSIRFVCRRSFRRPQHFHFDASRSGSHAAKAQWRRGATRRYHKRKRTTRIRRATQTLQKGRAPTGSDSTRQLSRSECEHEELQTSRLG